MWLATSYGEFVVLYLDFAIVGLHMNNEIKDK